MLRYMLYGGIMIAGALGTILIVFFQRGKGNGLGILGGSQDLSLFQVTKTRGPQKTIQRLTAWLLAVVMGLLIVYQILL